MPAVYADKEGRMMRPLPQIVLAAALFCLFSAPRAAADPIAVTNGFLLAVAAVDQPVSIAPRSTMTGPDFSFSTTVVHERLSGPFHAFLACDAAIGCAPGTPISFDAFPSTQNFEDGLINAALTLNGILYDDFTGGQEADNIVSLFLSQGSAIAPPFGDFSPVTLTAPFILSGAAFLNQNRPGGGDFFRLAGRGTATLLLTPAPVRDGEPPTGWVAQQLRYDFESPAVIPEPSTILLVVTGLAALVRFRK
jgi:PEP-CTERM motif